MTEPGPSITQLLRKSIGGPQDWNLRKPPEPRLQLSRRLVGPLFMVASVAFAWIPFNGAVGEDGNVAYGLWIGATSIILMAWSFVLAVRLPFLEPIFGGLDTMYRAHRWSGALAMLAMFLHTSAEPENDLIPGASKSIADDAEDLAGTGETMLYILVAISVLRWVPYRYWRWTHKLMGVPFAFACWHFFTASKSYANGSAWGWYFGTIMVLGLLAWVARVVVRDAFAQGVRYRVAATTPANGTIELELAPVGRKLDHESGQFSVIKIQRPGLREPHLFTIASSPDDANLHYFVRDLGDWSHRLQSEDIIGAEVFVEGPYGEFEPLPKTPQSVLWIAGGVGITPFLSAVESLEVHGENPPTLVYAVGSRTNATAATVLQTANDEGRIRLVWFESSAGRRFTRERLEEVVGADGLRDTHVAICGPIGLVRSAASAARSLGARNIETEDFDIRGGFGPDLSRTIAELTTR